MRRRTAVLVSAVAAAGIGLSALPAQGAPRSAKAKRTGKIPKSVTKKITVSDDYFAPGKVTVARGTTIKWVWGMDVNSHDVKLKSGPAGVRKFHSGAAAGQYDYSQKLTKPGTYSIICTLHQNMAMKIVVRK